MCFDNFSSNASNKNPVTNYDKHNLIFNFIPSDLIHMKEKSVENNGLAVTINL